MCGDAARGAAHAAHHTHRGQAHARVGWKEMKWRWGLMKWMKWMKLMMKKGEKWKKVKKMEGMWKRKMGSWS